jgi:hypothetical protein
MNITIDTYFLWGVIKEDAEEVYAYGPYGGKKSDAYGVSVQSWKKNTWKTKM